MTTHDSQKLAEEISNPRPAGATLCKAGGTDGAPDLQRIELTLREARRRFEELSETDEDTFLPYDDRNWERVLSFVRRTIAQVWMDRRVRLATPCLFPTPDGGIDIEWKTDEQEILINVPADSSSPAKLYGENNSGLALQGEIDIVGDTAWLKTWLAQ